MLKATSFISPTVCPLSLDPLRFIQSVPFTHHTQTLCQLVPHAKQFVFSNPNQKTLPVPCATCRGHSHFLRSFFISPFGANSRAARAFRSPPYLRFSPCSHTPFRHFATLMAPFRFLQRWLRAVFPFLFYVYWIEDFEQNNTSLVLVKMTSYWCCEYIPPFSQKVMYHINPAVIKSILSSMPKEEFYRHARFIHSQSLLLPEGSNRQVMFFNLWQWSLGIHKERFGG